MSNGKAMQLGDAIKPTRPRVRPADFPELPFIGLEHIEAHTMKLLGTVPAVTMKSSAVHFKPGDVLYSRLRPYLNKVYRPTFEGLCSAEFIVLPENEQLDGAFLKYVLNSVDFVRYASHLNAGDRPRVDFDQMALYEIPDLAIDEQRTAVAEIEKQFSRLDEAVANLKRVKANLKRYKAAVLKAAVESRLVPTESELAKKEARTYETGSEFLQRILAARRSKRKALGKYKEPTASTTGLAELPDGWVWAMVEEVADVGTGATPLRSCQDYYDGGAVPWITSGALNEEFIAKADEFITDLALRRTNAKIFPAHTLLVAMYGEGKTRGKVSELLIDAATNQACAALVLDGIAASTRDYLKLFLLKNYEDMRRLSSGGVQPNLNLSHIKATKFPFPPLAEQHRIVAEVDRRLSLSREVEVEVEVALKRATRLKKAILHRAFSTQFVLETVAKIPAEAKAESASRRASARHFDRAVLSAEIVHQLHKEPTFGRVKHQKVFHLCEHIARIDTVDAQYRRKAAGPLDNKLIYANEKELKKQNWYEEAPREEIGHIYRPLSKAGQHAKYLSRFTADQLTVVQQLIELMRKWDTDRCEIFSTAYAAWNDLILWGREATDEAILKEVLEHWHASKRRFPEERWRKAIAWIRKAGFAPTGFGKPTRDEN